jgi:hypothetical protein
MIRGVCFYLYNVSYHHRDGFMFSTNVVILGMFIIVRKKQKHIDLLTDKFESTYKKLVIPTNFPLPLYSTECFGVSPPLFLSDRFSRFWSPTCGLLARSE